MPLSLSEDEPYGSLKSASIRAYKKIIVEHFIDIENDFSFLTGVEFTVNQFGGVEEWRQGRPGSILTFLGRLNVEDCVTRGYMLYTATTRDLKNDTVESLTVSKAIDCES